MLAMSTWAAGGSDGSGWSWVVWQPWQLDISWHAGPCGRGGSEGGDVGCGSAQVSWKDVQVEASVLCSTGENFNGLSLGAAFKINLLNLSIGICFHLESVTKMYHIKGEI